MPLICLPAILACVEPIVADTKLPRAATMETAQQQWRQRQVKCFISLHSSLPVF